MQTTHLAGPPVLPPGASVRGASEDRLPQAVPPVNELITATALTIASWGAVIILFWRPIEALIDTWSHNRTFAHGFFVLPTCLYLIWCYRDRITRPSPQPWAKVALALPASGWLIGWKFEDLLLQQFSVVCMLPTLVYVIWGGLVFRQMLLPLGFLVFALPVGRSIEPWLQDVTTGFLSLTLQGSGISFEQSGYFLTLSSGTWEVAPDCGGLRYLLPGLALGYVYAAVVYRRPLYRLGFLLVCGAAMLLANGVRAYAIIMSDHLGIVDGTDHRIFSYSIYTVTVVVLAWMGRRWSTSEPMAINVGGARAESSMVVQATSNSVAAIALLALTPFTSGLFPGSPEPLLSASSSSVTLPHYSAHSRPDHAP